MGVVDVVDVVDMVVVVVVIHSRPWWWSLAARRCPTPFMQQHRRGRNGRLKGKADDARCSWRIRASAPIRRPCGWSLLPVRSCVGVP